MEVTTDENLQDIVDTVVKNGELTVSSSASYSGSIKVKAAIKSLSSYHGTGATKGSLTSPNSDSLKVTIEGASALQCSEGSVQKLVVKASGASKFDGSMLNASEVVANASGASKIKVSVSEKLSAAASGASKIEYSGSPIVEQSKSVTSAIRKTN